MYDGESVFVCVSLSAVCVRLFAVVIGTFAFVVVDLNSSSSILLVASWNETFCSYFNFTIIFRIG